MQKKRSSTLCNLKTTVNVTWAYRTIYFNCQHLPLSLKVIFLVKQAVGNQWDEALLPPGIPEENRILPPSGLPDEKAQKVPLPADLQDKVQLPADLSDEKAQKVPLPAGLPEKVPLPAGLPDEKVTLPGGLPDEKVPLPGGLPEEKFPQTASLLADGQADVVLNQDSLINSTSSQCKL